MNARSSVHLAVAALAIAGLSGCTKTVDTVSLDPLRDALGFCRAWYDAREAVDVRCAGYDPWYASIQAQRHHEEDCPGISDAVAAGRLRYDRGAAEACLSATASQNCWAIWGGPPACGQALAPAVPLHGTCLDYTECLAPATCQSAAPGCLGTCEWFLQQGETCGLGIACGPGLYCDAAGTGTCQPLLAPGQACVDYYSCQGGSTCAAGTCSYVASQGQDCSALACDSTAALYCEPSQHLCQPLPAASQPCGLGTLCAAGAFCDTSQGLCFLLPSGPQPDGFPCGDPYTCADSSFCDIDLARPLCTPRRTSGPCTHSEQCLPPYVCDGLGVEPSPACRLPRQTGAPCSLWANQCPSGDWCRQVAGGPAGQGVCTRWADEGQPCGALDGPQSEYADCAWGVCLMAGASDQVGTCHRFGALGDHCASSGDCRSAACDPQSSSCVAPTCP